MNSKEAIALLEQKGLRYQISPEDSEGKDFLVVDQNPKAKSKVDRNTAIVYIYSD